MLEDYGQDPLMLEDREILRPGLSPIWVKFVNITSLPNAVSKFILLGQYCKTTAYVFEQEATIGHTTLQFWVHNQEWSVLRLQDLQEFSFFFAISLGRELMIGYLKPKVY